MKDTRPPSLAVLAWLIDKKGGKDMVGVRTATAEVSYVQSYCPYESVSEMLNLRVLEMLEYHQIVLEA